MDWKPPDFAARKIWTSSATLTDAGDEVVEPVAGEERVPQAAEVQLQDPGHRVDVTVAFLVDQRVVTWTRERAHVKSRDERRTASRVNDELTSLEGVLDVIDLHLRAGHPEYALMLETCGGGKGH